MIQKGQGLSVIKKNELDWQYHISNCITQPAAELGLQISFCHFMTGLLMWIFIA